MYSSVQSEVRAEATYIKMKIMFIIEKKKLVIKSLTFGGKFCVFGESWMRQMTH